jgi:hypothetical protein
VQAGQASTGTQHLHLHTIASITAVHKSPCHTHAPHPHPMPTPLQETDPTGWWEETFNGHTDSKPKGPEAISLDLAFPGAQNVYGIPERATSLALKPTTGARAQLSPCTLRALCSERPQAHSQVAGCTCCVAPQLAACAQQGSGALSA